MKKKNIVLIVLAAAMLILMSVLAASYTQVVKEKTEADVTQRLDEITAANKAFFEMQMKEQINKVNTLSSYLGKCEVLDSKENIERLKAEAEGNGMTRIALLLPNGSFVTSDGRNTGDVSETPFFLSAMEGKFTISDPEPSFVDGSSTVIRLTGPIKRDGQVIGALSYAYLCNELDSVFHLSFMNGHGEVLVTDAKGVTLIGDRLEDKFGENVKERLKVEGESGIVSLVGEEKEKALFLSYRRLEYNDWYMFSAVPQKIAEQSLNYVAKRQRNLGIALVAGTAIYLLIAISLWVHTRNNVDRLTGARTLESFRLRAKYILRQNKGRQFVVIKLDVRNFKLINRIYGYRQGDRVIVNMAEAFKQILGAKDTAFARVGADEFILLRPYEGREKLEQVRAEFVCRFKELMGPEFSVNTDFPTGQYVTCYEDGVKPDLSEIFEKVNFAHRSAKTLSGSAIIDYEESIEKEAIFQQEIEDKMGNALENEEFSLFLQPKYSIPDEKLCGAEALVRWAVNGNIYVYSTDFVPVFERNGFIVKIDMYMFAKTAQFIRALMDKEIVPPVISVNFSRYHLNNSDFVKQLCEIADQYDVPHKYLEIELTETVICESVEQAMSVISQLHEEGFTVSIDDFGSGYSSLGLLKDLEVDVIKIDQKFFENFFVTYKATTIVAHLINMAKDLDITVVAEGVETKEIADVLCELQCDMIQGYYYAKPMAEDKMMRLIEGLREELK